MVPPGLDDSILLHHSLSVSSLISYFDSADFYFRLDGLNDYDFERCIYLPATYLGVTGVGNESVLFFDLKSCGSTGC